MKKLLFILLALVSLTVRAEKLTAVDADRQNQMVATINKAASAMTSMQCGFTQAKQLKMLNDKMTSTGTMHYKQGNRLRWQYTSPYTYTFLLNGTKVMMDSGKKRSVIDVKTNKMFQEIARIMMNSVTGKCLTDTKSFSVKMYTSASGAWVADLTPLNKQMRQMFTKVRLYFNLKTQMVDRVELHEKSGDNTVILLQNIKKNQTINDSVFKID